jgi:polyphosphate kinase
MEKGSDGYIFMKVNSLSDKDIVDKLYEASDAGVKIQIICRGICSIKAIGNISIKSIVGEYLEHSRIYKFGKTESKYFISSADLLTRNLDRRVEILVNISDSPIKDKLEKIINVLLEDEVNSFIMNESGDYSLPVLDEGNDSHIELYNI